MTWAGEVERRRSRATGTVVVLVDTEGEGDWIDVGENRWATVCDAHSTICGHRTRRLARHHMARPDGWCESCHEEL